MRYPSSVAKPTQVFESTVLSEQLRTQAVSVRAAGPTSVIDLILPVMYVREHGEASNSSSDGVEFADSCQKESTEGHRRGGRKG